MTESAFNLDSAAAATVNRFDDGRVVVVGEALIDVVQQVDGTVREHCGGSPANVAIAVGRLGYHVDLNTWLGTDAYSDIIQGWLTDSDVHVVTGVRAAPATPIASAVLDADGSASYTFELTWDLADDVEFPADTKVIHTGSLATILTPGSDKLLALLKRNTTATLVFDPNVRPSLIENAGESRARFEQFLDLADVVRASVADFEWLYPDEDPIAAAERLVRDRNPVLIVITQGPLGATGVCAAGKVSVPTAAKVIVDRVGAGDAATGALIDGLWQANLLGADKHKQLADIRIETLAAIVDWCAQLCAFNLSKAGTNPPRRDELATQLALPTTGK